MISLVAFLGNYGKKYEGNRHNTAWLFADTLPFANELSWQKKFKGQYASRKFPVTAGAVGASAGESHLVHFLKPETFMNLSGDAIGEVCSFFKIPPAEVLVVHDELELAPGVVSLKWAGGLGGHNGLRSTNSALGTPEFWRLRFGIGRPVHPDVSAHVLSDFSQDESILLSLVWPSAGKLLVSILEQGPEPYLKEWAKKKVAE